MSDTDAVAPAGSLVIRETAQAIALDDAFDAVLRPENEMANEPEHRFEAAFSLIETSAHASVFMPEKVGAFLLALSTRRDILLNLKAPHLERYIARSRQSCRADQIAGNLANIVGDLCRIDAAIVGPLFEFFACNLPPARLDEAYGSAITELHDAQLHCTRLAQSMQRFGEEGSLARLIIRLSETHLDWLRKPSMLRCFQPLLSSDARPDVAGQVGDEVMSRIESLTKATDRFRAAVLSGDRLLALRMLREHRNEFAETDFLRWMNSLRSLSSRLGEMAVRISELEIEAIDQRRMAAIIFGDLNAIEAMHRSGDLAAVSDLNAAALSQIGDNAALNAIIAAKYAGSPYSRIVVNGESAREVFRSAAASLQKTAAVDGPRVSVIMSAYNPDPELMKIALESFASQTLSNKELFIVDDASDVHSASMIAELADRFQDVTLIRLDQNLGPYVGRNHAMERASGEFIAIHDVDDWSHPQRLAAQLDHLLHNQEARAVTTEHIRIGRNGRVALEGHLETFGDGPMTSMFRADVFRDVGGFAAVRSRGDLEMQRRIARYYGPEANAIIRLPMALCLADPQSLSNSMSMRKAQHLALWRTNISRQPDLTALFRAGIPLRPAHQTPVPMMLRPRPGRPG